MKEGKERGGRGAEGGGSPLAVCCLSTSRHLSVAALLDSGGRVGGRDL